LSEEALVETGTRNEGPYCCRQNKSIIFVATSTLYLIQVS